MSEQWQALAEQLHTMEDERPDLLDLQINACLLTMARYLVEARRTSQVGRVATSSIPDLDSARDAQDSADAELDT